MKQIKPSEVNRTIAEILEPLASLPNAGQYADRWGMAKGTACWRTEFTNEVITDIVWAERDFLHDPRGTVMLLENLKCQVLWSGWPHSTSSGKEGVIGWIVSKGVLYSAESENLGVAVAHAFLRANGYEVSE